MFLLTDTALVTSASDLTLASDCEFAFLRVLDHRLGWDTDPLPPDDAMLERAAELGGIHENRLLERYRAEHGDALVSFSDDRPKGAEALRVRAEETRDALLAGAPVVYQGVFFDESELELPFVEARSRTSAVAALYAARHRGASPAPAAALSCPDPHVAVGPPARRSHPTRSVPARRARSGCGVVSSLP